jgi:polyhydroxybutyrate depolymerase
MPTAEIDPVDGFLQLAAPLPEYNTNSGAGLLRIAVGTTATSLNLSVDGVDRRYVVLRPDAALSNAPLLVMLHPSFASAETMANITNVSDYALTQGFWVVLPQAQAGGWNDDRSPSRDDDVRFISQLIDRVVADGGLDATRVYATGFSSGGFMTARLACDLPDKIAAFAIDAATMRNTVAAVCTPTVQRPKVYFLGTSDLIVAYNGVFPESPNGQRGAEGTIAFWNGLQRCGGLVSTTLPNRAADGTTVQLDAYSGCVDDTLLQLYTITNGGHAWPGGDPSFTGTTTDDIQATGLLWRFVRGYRR